VEERSPLIYTTRLVLRRGGSSLTSLIFLSKEKTLCLPALCEASGWGSTNKKEGGWGKKYFIGQDNFPHPKTLREGGEK